MRNKGKKHAINAILAVLKLFTTADTGIELDGIVGSHAKTAVNQLRENKANLTPDDINVLITTLAASGLNSRKLQADGQWGDELEKALDGFLAEAGPDASVTEASAVASAGE